jgi:hypothetical protein
MKPKTSSIDWLAHILLSFSFNIDGRPTHSYSISHVVSHPIDIVAILEACLVEHLDDLSNNSIHENLLVYAYQASL